MASPADHIDEDEYEEEYEEYTDELEEEFEEEEAGWFGDDSSNTIASTRPAFAGLVSSMLY